MAMINPETGKRYTIPASGHQDIVDAYTKWLEPAASIAQRYHVSRTAIWKLLRKLGVETRRGVATQIAVECEVCLKKFKRTRCQARANSLRSGRNFCSRACYFDWLRQGNYDAGGNPYVQSRKGQRRGRMMVSTVFDIPDGAIVHHIDRNTLNCSLDNLMVFANQGDHTKHHRDMPHNPPLFDGRQYLADKDRREEYHRKHLPAVLRKFRKPYRRQV